MRYDILISKLEFFGFHGVLEEEKKLGQKFIISAKLIINAPNAVEEDNCDKTVNYSDVCQMIGQIVEKERFDLIESLGDAIARRILVEFPLVESVTIQVDKPWAPIGLHVDNVSVVITRGWHNAYIGVGSNMGDCQANIEAAVKYIQESEFNRDVKVSTLIKTKPYGYVEQDDFLNGAIEIKTMFSPEELLHFLQKIELDLHRTREIHWGPRTIDLDIELFDNLIINEPDLIIPHHEMHKRSFVLQPLCELNPYLIHPVYGEYLIDLLSKINN